MPRRVTALAIAGLTLSAATALGAAGAAEECVPSPSAPCRRWVSVYDGTGVDPDRALAMALSPDGGRAFVTGQSSGASLDYGTVAYDAATGSELWAARYDGPAAGRDVATALVVSPDGEQVFVTGESAGPDQDLATIAYDAATGAQIWIQRFGLFPDRFDYASSLAVNLEGDRLFVTGYSQTPGLDYDFTTVAYDARTGETEWTSTYQGPGGGWDSPVAVAVGRVDGPFGEIEETVYVAGRSNGASAANEHADFAVVAYDPRTGVQRWVGRHDGPAGDRDIPGALAVAPDGHRVYLTGSSVDAGGVADFATVAFETDRGELVWAKIYTGMGGADTAREIIAGPAGDRVYITGVSEDELGAFDRSATTIAYDAETGAERWVARHGSTTGAVGVDLAVDANERRLYVSEWVGGIASTFTVPPVGRVSITRTEYGTIGYDAATGTQTWFDEYAGATHDDFASAIQLAPDGSRLYVTGGGLGTSGAYTTIAYAL